MAFVNKQLFWWSASITLDNNKDVLTDLYPFFHVILYHIPQLAWLVAFLYFFQFWIFGLIWPLCCLLVPFEVNMCHGAYRHENKYYRHDMGLSLNSTGDIWLFQNRHGNCKNNDRGHFLKSTLDIGDPPSRAPILVLRAITRQAEYTETLYKVSGIHYRIHLTYVSQNQLFHGI